MLMHQRSRILNMPVILTAVLALFVIAFTPALAKKKPKKLSTTQKNEIKIVKKIMDKHQKALELALIGDEKTTDTAVQAFCQTYATRMQSEIGQLQTWLNEWYKIAYAPRVGSADAYDDLLDLEGVEFTAELLGAMVGTHNTNIAHEKQADKRGYHKVLRTWAKATIKIERAEVAQIKAWLKVYDPEDEEDED